MKDAKNLEEIARACKEESSTALLAVEADISIFDVQFDIV